MNYNKAKKYRVAVIAVSLAAAVLLGLATVWLRGGFDAFRVKEHGAGGSERTVRVVFSDAGGGGSTFDVLPGGDASVSPDVPDGYIVEILSGDAVYEDGSITLHGVRTPQTVVYRVRKPGVFSLRVANDSNCGTVSPRVGLSTLAENALVRFSVTEKPGYTFAGYSLGAPLDKGGTLLSAERVYIYKATDNAAVYLNYRDASAVGSFVLRYHTNGGTVGGKNEVLTEKQSREFYLCPNARMNDGTIARRGYALVGYNTKADGSGTFYGCGWNIVMPESGEVDLYAVWLPETEAKYFKYTVSGNTATVTSCTATADTVVIPATLGGKKVTAIAGGALSGLRLKTLVLPPELSSLERAAVRDCTSLSTVYIFDRVSSMSDASFSGCTALSTFMMGASRLPVYHGQKHGTYSIKFERLYTADKPKIIIINGSNTAYGLNTASLISQLDGDYTVVNFGFNWKTPLTIFYEVAAHYIKPGDIVLSCPELMPQMWGENTAIGTMWEMFESCYEVMSMIDVRNYNNILGTFADFNKKCLGGKGVSYDARFADVDTYGDYTIVKEPNKAGDSYVQTAGRDFAVKIYLSAKNTANMNRAMDACRAAGAEIFISFPPTNRNCLSANSATAEYQAAFEAAIEERLHAKVISKISDYLVPGSYCFDSDYHLTTKATVWRTKQLADDLNRAIAELKKK